MNRFTRQRTSTPKNSRNLLFKPDNLTPLSQEDKLKCENSISTNECLNALKEFTNNKTPGNVGSTSGCYKFFWLELCIDIVPSLNHAFHSGTLSCSKRRGIISLIPKKDKAKFRRRTSHAPNRTQMRKFLCSTIISIRFGSCEVRCLN